MAEKASAMFNLKVKEVIKYFLLLFCLFSDTMKEGTEGVAEVAEMLRVEKNNHVRMLMIIKTRL